MRVLYIGPCRDILIGGFEPTIVVCDSMAVQIVHHGHAGGGRNTTRRLRPLTHFPVSRFTLVASRTIKSPPATTGRAQVSLAESSYFFSS